MKRRSRNLLFSLLLLPISLLVLASGLSLPKFLPQVREVIAPPSPAARTESAKTTLEPGRIGPSKRKVAATVETSKREYEPGEIVVITGSGWLQGESVELVLHANTSPSRADRTLYATADGAGHIHNDHYTLEEQDRGVRFVVTATGATTRRSARTAFGPDAVASPTANAAADIDQCTNGGVGQPPEPCTGANWVNGNANETKAHYLEGDSIPYRIKLTSLEAGSHTITIEWDTTQSGKHAIDYLTSYDRTESVGNNPCDGVVGCNLASFDTYPIPIDPNAVNQIAGVFTLFGGDITAVSSYTLNGSYAGNSSTSITITFTSTAGQDLVLAWGGHIATRGDWGANNAAVSISGSPYHTRLLDLDGSWLTSRRGFVLCDPLRLRNTTRRRLCSLDRRYNLRRRLTGRQCYLARRRSALEILSEIITDFITTAAGG